MVGLREVGGEAPREPDSDEDVGRSGEADGRSQERKRGRAMRRWLADPATKSSLLLWISLATPLMHLHYYLFNAGKVGGEDKDGMSALLNCCILSRSR
eukprot:8056812-Pyramimonas_sp.AAC.1